MSSVPQHHETGKGPESNPHPHGWAAKFGDAFRGLKSGTRGQNSFHVHFVVTVVVIAAAAMLHCSLIEWCILIMCIGGVLTAELFNSSIETLFHGLSQEARDRVFPSLDIAAGAVLVAAISAALVGLLIFGYRLSILYSLPSNY
jgi:diacylglycerol kinase